jgi:hypothetical protein
MKALLPPDDASVHVVEGTLQDSNAGSQELDENAA